MKFIRFAQMKMDGGDYRFVDENGIENTLTYKGANEGVVGIITNHSWLDNPTFRGMRQSLMKSFEQIYVLDLHGNNKKKEHAPDGGKDENVFDIEQGVAISLFVKRKGLERGEWRGDLWGKRLKKYQAAMDENMGSAINQQLKPVSPDYLLIKQDADMGAEYGTGTSLHDIFDTNSIGIVTARDNLTIQMTRNEAINVVKDFINLDVEAARSKYSLGSDVRDWRVDWAQNDVAETGLNDQQFQQISYRPYDKRWTYYSGHSRGFHCYPRDEVMRNLTNGAISLVVCKYTVTDWCHVLIAEGIVDNCFTSNRTKERGFVFPLIVGKQENFSANFRNFLDTRYDYHYTPEEILGFIYAVLHAPTYRKRYAEFLRIDFPRIPFPESKSDFDALSKLGWELVQAHLLKKLPRQKLADLQGKGDNGVEAIRYSPQEQAIHFNKAQSFAPVPEGVWNFHIGGYQVLDKYLKSRKGRKLSLDEINHVSAVADSLAFTIAQMAKIDAAYAQAFPQA